MTETLTHCEVCSEASVSVAHFGECPGSLDAVFASCGEQPRWVKPKQSSGDFAATEPDALTLQSVARAEVEGASPEYVAWQERQKAKAS